MLHPFVSAPSAPSPTRSVFAPVLALSAALHAGLVVAALTSTKEVQYTHKPEAVTEHVRYVELPFRGMPSPAPSAAPKAAPKARGKVRSVRRLSAHPASKVPQLLVLDVALPESAPLPDFQPQFAALEIGGGVDIGDDLLHLGVGEARSPQSASGRYNAYEEGVVEKRALAVTDNPKPQYPRRMLNRGIESNFNVYFVVDTSGVVDRETLELPPSVQEEFTRAVVDVLVRWHFVPAEMGGRRVRQRVLQPFIFRLERRFSSLSRP